MAVTLRLTRLGKKHKPIYRIVAVERRKKRDGTYLEKIGFYSPQEDVFEIDQGRLTEWKRKGAIISEGLRKLLKYKKIT